MLTIAICDDEAAQVRLLGDMTRDWAANRERPVAVKAFPSAEAFLFAYEQDGAVDVLLLDIQMEKMNGVALAQMIREKNKAMQIVFVTGLAERMAEGYDVDALHYLVKPVRKDKLFDVLDRAAERVKTAGRMVLLTQGGQKVRVPADDILYAEAFSHEVSVVTAKQTLRLAKKMGDLENELGEGFFRCHRSYIVGMKRVRKVTRAAMVLDTGKEIPLSRALYDEANRLFIRST